MGTTNRRAPEQEEQTPPVSRRAMAAALSQVARLCRRDAPEGEGVAVALLPSVLTVFCRDHSAAACMALPRFVRALAELLMTSPHELLLVPYSECTLFVGVSRCGRCGRCCGEIGGRTPTVSGTHGRVALSHGH